MHGDEDEEQKDEREEEERAKAQGKQQKEDKSLLARLRADPGEEAGLKRQLQAEEVDTPIGGIQATAPACCYLPALSRCEMTLMISLRHDPSNVGVHPG